MNWLHRVQAHAATMRKALRRTAVGALLLTVSISTAAYGQIRLTGASDADWAVLTVASDGAWGTATEAYISQAISGAISRCRAMSNRTLGCGAQLVSIQRGWAFALRCGD